MPMPVEKAPQMVITGKYSLLWNLSLALSRMENADPETSLRHNTVRDRQTGQHFLKISGGTTEELEEIRQAVPKGLTILIDCFRVNDKEVLRNERGGQVRKRKDLRAKRHSNRRGQKIIA